MDYKKSIFGFILVSFFFLGCPHVASFNPVTIPAYVPPPANVPEAAKAGVFIKGAGNPTSISIPAIDPTSGKAVTGIATDAFKGFTNVTTIIIPESVLVIGAGAFNGCTSLETIIIPDSVISAIGANTFLGCTSLTSITIGNGVTGTIAATAFAGCPNLETVTIGNNVTALGQAFIGSTSLKTVEIGTGLTGTISSAVGFKGNSSLETITIGSGKIGGSAFENCTNLTTITIGANVASITPIPSSSGNASVLSLELGNSVEKTSTPSVFIGGNAFRGCTNLATVIIDNTELVAAISDEFAQGGLVANATTISVPAGTTIGVYLSNTDNFAKTTADGYDTYTKIDQPEFKYTKIENTTNDYALTRYNGTATDITSFTGIPENGIVTSIGASAFKGNTTLASITIPDSVISIEANAFDGCTSLKTVLTGNGVSSIKDSAFKNCTKLETVTLGTGFTGKPISKAFKGNESLKTVTIGSGKIGGSAFEGCSNLTRVTIGANVEALSSSVFIGTNAFAGCANLATVIIDNAALALVITSETAQGGLVANASTISVPTDTSVDAYLETDNFVKTIADGYDKYTKTAQPEFKYTKIDETNTYELTKYNGVATSITEFTGIPTDGSITKIAATAFARIKTTLTSIAIPATVTAIEENTFKGFTALESVTINSGVKTIGASAFSACTNLTTITIPANVTLLDTTAFTGCTALATVKIDSTAIATSISNTDSLVSNAIKILVLNSISGSTGIFDTSKFTADSNQDEGSYKAYVKKVITPPPTGYEFISGNSYKLVLYTGENDVVWSALPDDGVVTEIAATAFANHKATLTSIAIPATVTAIAAKTFEGFTALTSVTINEGLAAIGASAFSGCTKLETITIPDSVTSIIAGNTFLDCTSLTSVTIGNGVTGTIAETAFDGCTKLETVIIGTGLTVPLGNAFKGNTSLKTITIGSAKDKNTAAALGISFEDCTSLTSVTIGNGVIGKIGDGAFKNCDNLEKVTIGTGVSSIGKAFQNKANLTTVIIDNPTLALAITSETAQGGLVANATTISVPAGTTVDTYLSNADNFTKTIADEYDIYTKVILKDFEYTQIGSTTNYTLTKYNGSETNITEFPDVPTGGTVTGIGANAFEDNTTITAITIPNKVTAIGDNAFKGSTNLANVTFAATSTLATIGANAFANNTTITEITIPASVTSLATDAFTGCTALATVTIDSSTVANAIDKTDSLVSNATSIFVNQTIADTSSGNGIFDTTQFTAESGGTTGTHNKYTKAASTGFTNNTYDNGTLTKYTAANGIDVTLEAITAGLPSGTTLTGIAVGAFSDIKDTMTSIVIPDTVTAIAAKTFEDFTALETVIIGDGVKTIPATAFTGCIALETLTIGKGLTHPLGNAFKGNTSLKTITIGSAKDNGSAAALGTSFENCTSLTSVTIGNNVIGKIGDGAFKGCSSLETVAIGNGVTSIGNTFKDKASLKIITIGDGVTGTIGANAFNATALETVTIGNGVTSIGTAFKDKAHLTTIKLGTNVKSIPAAAFTSCRKLTTVYAYKDNLMKTANGVQKLGGLTDFTVTNTTEDGYTHKYTREVTP